MLVLSTQQRATVQHGLAQVFRTERLVSRIVLDGGEPTVATCGWREFWEPCIRFAGEDTRLLHRLNRLKAAWRALLRSGPLRAVSTRYCWRYFGLLHHTIRIGMEKKSGEAILPVLRRIVGFETFTVEVPGLDSQAGGIACHRNPVYLLGRLPDAVCNPTPRHVPIILPCDAFAPFYHYRQYTLSEHKTKLLLFPSIDLGGRQQSFTAIDRFARLTANRPDPFANSRARVLSRRVILPLVRAILAEKRNGNKDDRLRILDLGSGTGHLIGQISVEIRRAPTLKRGQSLEISCVDSCAPSGGRTHGLSGTAKSVSSLEWITADYRQLLDEDSWIRKHEGFQIAMLCRLLDNMSLFSLEATSGLGEGFRSDSDECLPEHCLSPRLFPSGIQRLQLGTSKRPTPAGKCMPQQSLAAFFTAMKAVHLNEDAPIIRGERTLPCRRYNPASLITRSGKSVIAQLLHLTTAVVIEDLDLTPEGLKQHLGQFGVTNVSALQFVRDGFSTEAYHYVLASPAIVRQLKGTRIW